MLAFASMTILTFITLLSINENVVLAKARTSQGLGAERYLSANGI